MTNKTEIQNYLLTTIDASMDTQLASWIAQVQQYIETFTGKKFSQADNPTEKTFDGNGRDMLLVEEFTSFDKANIGDSTDEMDVTPYPLNEDVKYKLYSASGFPTGRANIKVSAIWGSPVPPDLKFAATVLVAGIIQYAGPKAGGNVVQERIGNYSVTYKDDQQASDFAKAKDILIQNKNYFI